MTQLNNLHEQLNASISGNRLVLSSAVLAVPALSSFLDSLPGGQISIDVPTGTEVLALQSETAPATLTITGDSSDQWTLEQYGIGNPTVRRVELALQQATPTSPVAVQKLTISIQLRVGQETLLFDGVMTGQSEMTYAYRKVPSSNLPSLVELHQFVRLGNETPFVIFELPAFKRIDIEQFDLVLDLASQTPVDLRLITSFLDSNWSLDQAQNLGVDNFTYHLSHKIFLNEARQITTTRESKVLRGTVTLGLPFDFTVPLHTGHHQAICIHPRAESLPSLTHLATLMGEPAWVRTVEDGLGIIGLEDFALTGVTLTSDTSAPKIIHIALQATAIFLENAFDVEFSFPDLTLSVAQRRGQSLPLDTLFRHYFSGLPTLPQVDITNFSIFSNLRSNSYRTSFSAQENWVFPLTNDTSFTFEQLLVDINKVGADVSGSLSTAMSVGAVKIYLVAQSPLGPADGWRFRGETGVGEDVSIGQFVADVATQFKFAASTPSVLANLMISHLRTSFDTKTKDFTFSFEAELPINTDGSKALDVIIEMAITHNNGSYTRQFSGIVKAGDLEFDLIFREEQGADTIFLAAYENRSAKSENIAELLSLFMEPADIPPVANELYFDLKDALLVIDKKTSSTDILFGLDIGGGIDFSNLPLVGKTLPKAAALRMTFQPVIANQAFSEATLDQVRPLVPDGGFQLPEQVQKGVGFAMQLMIGEETIDLNLPIDLQDVGTQSPSYVMTNTASLPPGDSATIRWFPIQKQLGPVTFGRIGLQFQDDKLYCLLDASISLAGLSISLDGLYAASTLQELQPAYGLHGLGIDYKKGPLEIGGTLLRRTIRDGFGNSYDQYSGTAIIRTEAFTLKALGAYAYYEGHPSLMVYALADVPLGGPPFLFVTGLAAGFGYNRRLVVPSVNEVRNFPLVADAVTADVGGNNDPQVKIRVLADYVPPAVGESFLAAGVRFSSFKIIDSFVLLSVSFGLDFEVDVFGVSTLLIPAPALRPDTEPLAEIQLVLQAVYSPEKGFLKVRGGLTSDSYVLSSSLHLAGNFAFFTWFKDDLEDGAHAGDFALVAGGYHPQYVVPDHYPRVNPLVFNWQLSSEVWAKGDFYFALLPSAIMTGGHLNITWMGSQLKAWFKLAADFIISWQPYFYDATMYAEMRVSYTYELYGTQHVTVDAGADLHVWGPEFSGQAHVHLWIVTFDVSFGSAIRTAPPALTWNEFQTAFLPPADKWHSLRVTGGLIEQSGTDDDPLYVVNPAQFQVETTSVIPVTAMDLLPMMELSTLNIGAMKITDDGLKSIYGCKIMRDGTDVTHLFEYRPVKKDVPAALWGKQFTHTEKEEQMIADQCVGFSILWKNPILPSTETHDVNSANLLQGPTAFNNGTPCDFTQQVSLGGQWLKTTGRSVVEQIEARTNVRAEVLQQLGFTEEFYPNATIADSLMLTNA